MNHGEEAERLCANILDVIKEQQVKLGFREEVIRLYYPLESLNAILRTELGEEQMQEHLPVVLQELEERLGKTEVSHQVRRFCLGFSPEASVYVHENTPQEGFLYDFIEVMGRHGATIGEVEEVFRRYSDKVVVKGRPTPDFDWLFFFTDGKPDDFRYCIADEGMHLTYHRFTPEDYQGLYGER